MSMAGWRQEKMLLLIEARAARAAPAPSYAELAAAAGLSDPGSGVRDGLADLARRGLIDRESRNGNAARYYVASIGKWTGWSRSGRVSKAESRARIRREMVAPASETRRRARMRECLRCDREFASEGPHHRLCDGCRQHAAEASPLLTSEYGVGA